MIQQLINFRHNAERPAYRCFKSGKSKGGNVEPVINNVDNDWILSTPFFCSLSTLWSTLAKLKIKIALESTPKVQQLPLPGV